MSFDSCISFVPVQFQLVLLHICGKELPNNRYSCIGSPGPQPVFLRWSGDQVHKDLDVAEKV